MEWNDNPNEQQHQRQRQQRRLRGWGFEFFGETTQTSRHEDSTAEMSQSFANYGSFPLAMAGVGDRVSIVGFRGKGGISRLLSMGLTPGTELRIVSCTPSGSVIVAVGDNRIGVGAGMAHKILVTDTRDKEKAMNVNTYLRDLGVGSKGRIVGYQKVVGAHKRKLLAMGLTPGTEFTIIRHAPMGDPIEIEVRGFNLSLRKHEADVLCIEEVENE